MTPAQTEQSLHSRAGTLIYKLGADSILPEVPDVPRTESGVAIVKILRRSDRMDFPLDRNALPGEQGRRQFRN